MDTRFMVTDFTKKIYEGKEDYAIKLIKQFNRGVITLPREYLHHIQGVYKVEAIKSYNDFNDEEKERYKTSVVVSRY